MTANDVKLAILDFTRTPGPRKIAEGDSSGEEFLKKFLRPRFVEARETGGKLLIDLNGAAGYPTSFLEEAFGGLAREFGNAEVEKHVDVRCDDEPYVLDEIRKYIRAARKQ